MDRLDIRMMEASEADAVSAVIVAAIRAGLPSRYSAAVVEALAAANSPAAVLQHAPKQTDYAGAVSGRIVGMIGLKRNEIGHLFVHPDFNGQGFGRRLVEFAVGVFRGQGYRDMLVMSSLNAEGFYERCGFTAEGMGSFEVAPGLPLPYIRMRAEIAPA